jgi:hypothetical protein
VQDDIAQSVVKELRTTPLGDARGCNRGESLNRSRGGRGEGPHDRRRGEVRSFKAPNSLLAFIAARDNCFIISRTRRCSSSLG